MIIRYLRLPYQFDAALLAEEVQALTSRWIPHFNKYDYTGDWGALPLRSPGGRADLAFADSLDGTSFENTAYLEQCPAIRQVIDMLPGNKLSARLLKLSKGAVIKEHRDRELAFEQGEARLHIPVITHPEVEFWLDGDRLVMQPGECWYINANLPHKLSNPSPVDRIHLVVDVQVNDAVRSAFDAVETSHKSMKEETFDRELKQKAILELLENPDPRMQEWAKKMQEEMQDQDAGTRNQR